LHFARIMHTAQGDRNQRTAAAYAECQALWRVLNAPKAQPGVCPACGRSLDPPNAVFDAAPIPFEGSFIHFSCIRQFAFSRWHQAKQVLSGFGIRV
jgi:hypothetical protein